MRIYERLAHALPAGYKKTLHASFHYAGFEERKIERLIGFMVMFAIALGAGAGVMAYVFEFGLLAIGVGGLGAVIALVTLQTLVALVGDSRSKNIDIVLPDCLQLIASNIRAGASVDQAIWLSARPEFGILEDEVRKVGTKTIGGKPLNAALIEMAHDIKSDMLDRAVKLLVEGLDAGGEIAKLLEETAANIRTAESMRKEIRAAVVMYAILILFAAVFGAPLLFAISIQFVGAMSKLWAPTTMTNSMPETTGSFSMIKAGPPPITADELLYFAISAISITTFFAAMIISLIQHGNQRNGIKYIPMFMTTALVIFFAAKAALTGLLGFI